MIKAHCLVGWSERSEVRHGKPDEILCVGLRFAHSDGQFIMTIYNLKWCYYKRAAEVVSMPHKAS